MTVPPPPHTGLYPPLNTYRVKNGRRSGIFTIYTAKVVIVGCYIWYSEDGTGRGHSRPRPHLAVPNAAVHRQRPVYQSPYCCMIVRCSLVYRPAPDLIEFNMYRVRNKCSGDDTKAAARQSLNCIKNKKNTRYGEKRYSIWRMEFLHPAMWHVALKS